MEREGTIRWRRNYKYWNSPGEAFKNHENCTHFEWNLKATRKNYGFAMEFLQYEMNRGHGDLAFLAVENGTERRVRPKGLLPVLVPSEQVRIVLIVSPDLFTDSLLGLKFTEHPLRSFPALGLSNRQYVCTGLTDLPLVIVCDGVNHCEDDEDEASCPWREQCGDWHPYRDHCLKVVVWDSIEIVPGRLHPTVPNSAAAECQKLGAHLVTLPDTEGVDIAVKMLRRSGNKGAVTGLRRAVTHNPKLKHLYRFMWQWGLAHSSIAYQQMGIQRPRTNGDADTRNECRSKADCSVMVLDDYPTTTIVFRSVDCNQHSQEGKVVDVTSYICMKPKQDKRLEAVRVDSVQLAKPQSVIDQFPTKPCNDGSLVRVFHLCQWDYEDADAASVEQWSPNEFSLFPCRYGSAVHYSLVCDGKRDCADASDELGCQAPQQPPLTDSTFVCQNKQVVPVHMYCNGHVDCFDESDEEGCQACYGNRWVMCRLHGCVNMVNAAFISSCPDMLPAWSILSLGTHVKLDGYGMSDMFNGDQKTTGCGEGFFQCTDSYCIPTYLVNNGEVDCPLGDDEGIPTHKLTCPGYYRCHNSGSCVHRDYVCDGVYHCPDKDDEMYCHLKCPQHCVCEGLAFKCSAIIDPLQHLHLRYLDLSHASNVSLHNVHFMEFLRFLNLVSCHLVDIHLEAMPQLVTLNLSHNALSNLSSLSLSGLPSLTLLDLSHNRFVRTLDADFAALLKVGQLQGVETLLMTNASIRRINGDVFASLSKIKMLDLRTNDIIEHEQNCFRGLQRFAVLYTDVPKLCCDYFLPNTDATCRAPKDELSSCSDLLAQDFFRIFLWLFSVLALTGNAGVLVYRHFSGRKTSSSPFRILVQNLCVADFLMGGYMLMIGAADAVYRDVYVEKEREWTQSVVCTVAGVISLLSSEVSALVICLITLDRVLVICFSFDKSLHLSCRTTVIACCGTWTVGVLLASMPLLAGLEFYGQNGICIPLPITRHEFSGQTYAFAVFICLNFVLVVFTGVGQVAIYSAVLKAGAGVGVNHSKRDVALARRLLLVVVSDFLCWFPIGLLGLLASGGVSVPGEVNVWAAIFVLPLNSALNPFLYTLNGVLEQRRRRLMEERTKRMLGKLQTDIPTWTPANVEHLIRICVRSKLVDNALLVKLSGVRCQCQPDAATLVSECPTVDSDITS